MENYDHREGFTFYPRGLGCQGRARLRHGCCTGGLPGLPAIYARHFSVAELNELSAFYRTPIGAKALREMPRVMGEFTATLVPRLQEVQQQASAAFDKILREHGYKK